MHFSRKSSLFPSRLYAFSFLPYYRKNLLITVFEEVEMNYDGGFASK
jgi:hypothetical protein